MAGCGSDSTPTTTLAPFQPEIVNNPDAFSLQATNVENVSAQLIYTWSNSGAQATIDHSTALTGGTATVSILDSNDSLVYIQGLLASGTESSIVGVAGDWRIVTTLTNCSGTLNFSVQKL